MKLLAVDGNSLINRAYYGVPILSNKKGEFTNAIYGFINMLGHILTMEEFDGVAVAFDLKKPTFRHKMYKDYKAGRKPMPEELREQFAPIKEYIKAMGYTVLEAETYEADDILGTLSDICRKSKDECYIASGDRDSFQLISENTCVLHTVTKGGKPTIIKYTEKEIEEKYGVKPKQMIDIKALQGDASDNIPGVAGIGEKTASALIREYGSIDYIYENIDSLEIKDGIRNKLKASKESAYLSYKLGKISTEAPIDKNAENYKNKEMDAAAVAAFLTKYELFSLLKKMNLSAAESKKDQTPAVKYCENEVSTEGSLSLVFYDDGIAAADGKNVCFLSFLENLQKIKDILENENIKKSVYDLKSAYHICSGRGIDINGVIFDAMLGGYLLSPSESSYDIKRLSLVYKVKVPSVESADERPAAAALLFETDKVLFEKIKSDGMYELLENIELPLSRVLADMEESGFLIDTEAVKEMGEELSVKLSELEKSIYSLCSCEFNINSPKQLGEVLFEKLGLPAKKKTKSGYSTDAKTLESLRGYHAVIDLILEYRKFAKLKSTYCDGLVKCADTAGRVHSTLNQTETRTGRISSTEPNLQNIPVRTEEGSKLRKFFIAGKGNTLIDADYSQIELRVLAHMANDKNMIDAFNNNEDIHLQTASQVFSLPKNMITHTLRSRAKAVNFGIVYGIGAFSLAKDIGVTRKEAQSYIDGYLNYYSGIASYMEDVIKKAKEDGFVKTEFGRRRYLPELSSSNGMLRAFGERVARNMPIQGTAADIIKIAMVRVFDRFKRENLDARIIMQVHDELIVEAKKEIAPLAAKILKEEMENAAKLSIKLVADTNIGETWYDAKG